MGRYGYEDWYTAPSFPSEIVPVDPVERSKMRGGTLVFSGTGVSIGWVQGMGGKVEDALRHRQVLDGAALILGNPRKSLTAYFNGKDVTDQLRAAVDVVYPAGYPSPVKVDVPRTTGVITGDARNLYGGSSRRRY